MDSSYVPERLGFGRESGEIQRSAEAKRRRWPANFMSLSSAEYLTFMRAY